MPMNKVSTLERRTVQLTLVCMLVLYGLLIWLS